MASFQLAPVVSSGPRTWVIFHQPLVPLGKCPVIVDLGNTRSSLHRERLYRRRVGFEKALDGEIDARCDPRPIQINGYEPVVNTEGGRCACREQIGLTLSDVEVDVCTYGVYLVRKSLSGDDLLEKPSVELELEDVGGVKLVELLRVVQIGGLRATGLEVNDYEHWITLLILHLEDIVRLTVDI